MRPIILFVSLAAAPLAAQTPRAVLPADLQIRLAVQAAPAGLRAGATVQGYAPGGAFVTLRQGTNHLICVAPAPDAEALEVSCHHQDFEAYLARGRELRAQGVVADQRNRRRWDEVAAGRLRLPSGTTNTILNGSGFDTATAEIREPRIRWVIYTPNATAASTGLPDAPLVPGAPWIMFPGTPGAHIMITPPRAAPANR